MYITEELNTSINYFNNTTILKQAKKKTTTNINKQYKKSHRITYKYHYTWILL